MKAGLTFTLALVLAAPVFAARDNTSFLNGRPFQHLNDAIADLTDRVSSLEADVARIDIEMLSLDARIASNSTAINNLINSTAALEADLDALAAQHQADFDAIEAALAVIRGDIDALEQELAQARSDLETQIADGDAGLQALINSLEDDLADANAALADLEAAQDGLAQDIAGLELQADALAGRVSTLESLHGPSACDTGNDPGTGSPWVVCRADQNEAWISANNRGTYHAEAICQELGYTSVKNWSGTCGNVCGYCQGPTSCENPGLSSDDREQRPWSRYNCGTDALGRKICITVQWICSR